MKVTSGSDAHEPGESGAWEVRGSVAIHRDLPCVARDGVTLRADVYRPAAETRSPTLVCRTPYGKHADRYVQVAMALAARGYCVVVQDDRGRYASEGEYRWMWADREWTGDHLDGFDTVEWAARLPWSTGEVGVFGHSNEAWSVFMLLSTDPPSVRAAVAGGMPPNARDFSFGIFETGRRLQWIYEQAADARRRLGSRDGPTTPEAAGDAWRGVERGKYLWWLPLATIPDRVFSGLADQYRALLRSHHEDLIHLWDLYPRIKVPMLLLTGWWDRMANTIDHFPGLMAAGPSDLTTKHRLLVGPWGHDPLWHMSRRLGPIDHGAAAEGDYAGILADWFDQHLGQAALGDGGDLPIRLFILGADEWRAEASWPLARTVYTPAYLASAGAANTVDGDGILSIGAPVTGPDAPDRYAYDPRDPVMSLVNPDCFVVPVDQAPRGYRHDVLVYQTAPLERPLTLIGPVELALWAASDAVDTDWMATLAVVHTDGTAVNLTYGACRSRFRHGFDRPTLLTPGSPEEFHIPLHPVGCVLQEGERLRLYVSSSDFPNMDRNHNVGRDDLFDPELRIARQTIYHSAERPSRLILPVVPADR